MVYATYNSVKRLMVEKFKNPNNGKKRWTPKEVAYLKAEYPHMQTHRIARYLGRNYKAVSRKAECLGLRKTAFSKGKINRKCGKRTRYNPVL